MPCILRAVSCGLKWQESLSPYFLSGTWNRRLVPIFNWWTPVWFWWLRIGAAFFFSPVNFHSLRFLYIIMSCLSRCIVFWALYIGKNFIYYKNIIFICNFNVNVSKWCIDIGIYFQNLIQSLWVDLTNHLNLWNLKFFKSIEWLRILDLLTVPNWIVKKNYIFRKKLNLHLSIITTLWLFWDNKYLSTRLIVFYFMNNSL